MKSVLSVFLFTLVLLSGCIKQKLVNMENGKNKSQPSENFEFNQQQYQNLTSQLRFASDMQSIKDIYFEKDLSKKNSKLIERVLKPLALKISIEINNIIKSSQTLENQKNIGIKLLNDLDAHIKSGMEYSWFIKFIPDFLLFVTNAIVYNENNLSKSFINDILSMYPRILLIPLWLDAHKNNGAEKLDFVSVEIEHFNAVSEIPVILLGVTADRIPADNVEFNPMQMWDHDLDHGLWKIGYLGQILPRYFLHLNSIISNANGHEVPIVAEQPLSQLEFDSLLEKRMLFQTQLFAKIKNDTHLTSQQKNLFEKLWFFISHEGAGKKYVSFNFDLKTFVQKMLTDLIDIDVIFNNYNVNDDINGTSLSDMLLLPKASFDV